MGRLVLITGSRKATEAMLTKAREVVEWVAKRGDGVIVGDAEGVDAEVRDACHVLQVPVAVYGGYGKIRGRCYPGEEYYTISGDYLMRDRVMAKRCDVCVALKNRQSRTDGTGATYRYAKRFGKQGHWREFGSQ